MLFDSTLHEKSLPVKDSDLTMMQFTWMTLLQVKSLGESGKSKLTHRQSLEMIRRWFIEEQGENQRFLWDQDRPAVDWLQQQVRGTHHKTNCVT